MPLACWQPRVSKHSCAGSKNASRSLQTSHVGTARKSRCRSSASMAMAAIEAGDRQEMVPEGLGALLCSLALAADGPFEAAAGQPWQQGFFRADLPPPAHHCDREHGSEPSEAQIRAHGRFDRDLPAATAGSPPAMTAPGPFASQKGEVDHSDIGIPLQMQF